MDPELPSRITRLQVPLEPKHELCQQQVISSVLVLCTGVVEHCEHL